MVNYLLLKSWTDPPHLTNRATWTNLLQWVLGQMTVPADRISFLFLETGNADLETLRASCTFLQPCTISLETFRLILFHLASPPQLNPQETTNLDTLIKTSIAPTEQETRDILLSYYPANQPPPQGSSTLDLFLHWARAMLALLSFSFAKTAASIDLLTAYETLSLVVGRAHPLIQGLDLGVNDRHDACTLGRQIVQARDDVKPKPWPTSISDNLYILTRLK